MKIRSKVILASVLGLSLLGNTNASAIELDSSSSVTSLSYSLSKDFNKSLLNYATQDQIDYYKGVYATQASAELESLTIGTQEAVYLTYNEYFSKVEWITRGGTVSLSITPKTTLTNVSNANVKMARAFHSFSLLEGKFKSDSRWKNGGSLSAQYHCHVLAAGQLKTPWYIEPHRTETGLWEVMFGACNPKN
ncbi:DUF2599 domain-containing protein [Metasolibacillus meyeri]|uniref:DUF2599 domain-containing protein n=1 Tax=Metasolibacillus meyeri TaxID=1071052 RepID=A0AAW9NM29_9BACL|nr:DUF2599 domain-containing protein [Metasolibacillus meyeri]MEC1177020.1 DUF2599 domain-containing protein [Metasolibacillus meyeri]